MMRLLLLAITFILPFGLYSQQEGVEYPITSKTIFRDVDGQIISFDAFLEQTSGQNYLMEPVFDEEENIREIYIIEPSVSTSYRAETPLFVRSAQQQSYAAPDFSANDLQGNSYQLSELRGQVVVLKFWFINCRPCILEIPELNQLVSDYQGQEVVFLAPTLDESSAIRPFLSSKPFQYQILASARPLAHQFNVFSYPTHMVINREGMVEAVFVGVNTHIRQLLSAAIDKALYGEEEVEGSVSAQRSGEIAEPNSNGEVEVEVEEKSENKGEVKREEKEVETINTTDVIRDESGELIPFGRFLQLANSGQYIAVRRYDQAGQAYVLLKLKQ